MIETHGGMNKVEVRKKILKKEKGTGGGFKWCGRGATPARGTQNTFTSVREGSGRVAEGTKRE